MSRLRELIKELCPDGVEYRKLGEIAEIIRGNGLQKKDFVDSGVGCIHYGQIYTKYGAFADETLTYVSPELAATLKKVSTGDLVVAITSENVEDVCKCVAWLGNDDIVTGGHAAIVKHEQNPKYLSYIFQTEEFFRQKRKYVIGTKVIEMSPKKLAEIIIPVPPLPIQNEIVKMLDNFTELTATLTAELLLRKKQYNFYRDSLLNFVRVDDTIVQTDRQTDRQTALRIGKIGLPKQSVAVEWRTLGEVAKIVRGASPRPIQKFISKSSDAVAWVKIGDAGISAKYIFKTAEKITPEGAQKSRKVGLGDLILSNSMSFGRPYLMKIEGYIHDGWLAITEYDKTYQSDFLYYLLSSGPVQDEMKKRASFGGAVQNLNLDIVKDLYLPIPSLETQAKIVSILDRFDALCNDLTQGLPAEIVARKKQYEYYRDKLLTFRRKGA